MRRGTCDKDLLDFLRNSFFVTMKTSVRASLSSCSQRHHDHVAPVLDGIRFSGPCMDLFCTTRSENNGKQGSDWILVIFKTPSMTNDTHRRIHAMLSFVP